MAWAFPKRSLSLKILLKKHFTLNPSGFVAASVLLTVTLPSRLATAKLRAYPLSMLLLELLSAVVGGDVHLAYGDATLAKEITFLIKYVCI